MSPLLWILAVFPSSEPAPIVPRIRALVQPEIDKHLAAAQAVTFSELAIADSIPAKFKTPLRQRAVKDPWGALTELEARGLELAAASRGGLAALPIVVDHTWKFLDKPAATVPTKPSGPLVTLDDHLRRIEAILDAAATLREEALAKVSAHERAFLFNRPPRLIQEFGPQASAFAESRPDLRDDLAFCTAWAQHVDHAKFPASLRTLLQLVDPVFLDSLKAAMAKASPGAASVPGIAGQLLAVKETRHGLIILGGAGKNTYDLRQPVAFLADLAGDDEYRGVIASSFDVDHPFGIVVDFAGNDRYEANELGLATGRLGVGLLVDRAGNDVYKLAPGSGGCGFAGVGLLIDEAGDDQYLGTRFTQGAAVAGLGLLLDMDGRDEYSAHGFALGISGPLGVGALIDVKGNDHYRCGFQYGSAYNQSDAPSAKPGDANYQYDAFGLGMGLGRRTYPLTEDVREFQLAGGFGVWIDLEGDDRSESSNFTQACGYYFGTGLKLDLAGNDRHAAARYGQAAGAHYGLGLFLDYAGDDVHEGVGPTYNLGCAWDRSVFLFADASGDDVYDWTHSSGGGRGDRGGWGVFADLGGNDKYRTGGVPGGASEKAIGVFLDAAGHDEYPKPGPTGLPANGVTKAHGIGGLFIDR